MLSDNFPIKLFCRRNEIILYHNYETSDPLKCKYLQKQSLNERRSIKNISILMFLIRTNMSQNYTIVKTYKIELIIKTKQIFDLIQFIHPSVRLK